jgi:hypothetical protein
MKSKLFILAILIFAGFSISLNAEEKSKNQLNYEKKLTKAYFKNAKWYTDFDEAKEASKKEGKPIFAYFTRSYSP